jgi:hypothetical protein
MLPCLTPDQFGWLSTLLASHRELSRRLEVEGIPDCDPLATLEMYRECEAALDVLRMTTPGLVPEAPVCVGSVFDAEIPW